MKTEQDISMKTEQDDNLHFQIPLLILSPQDHSCPVIM